jgi:hypothetical protein
METKPYTEQCIQGIVLRRPSRHKYCNVTNGSGICVFLTLMILQGIVRKPILEWYCNKKHLTNTYLFESDSLPLFVLLKWFLHFSDSSTYNSITHPTSKLNKIWPVFTHLNKHFSSSVIPENDVTASKCLLLYKGRLSCIQHIPLKRAQFTIKNYLLCVSKSWYIWSSIIYNGKGITLIRVTRTSLFHHR